MKMSVSSTGFGVVAGLVIATSASAYQFEASGVYIDFDDLNDSSLGVAGQYHFSNVDDSGIPRAEASYLRRSSNIGAFFATTDESDQDILGVRGEAYIQNFYAAAGLTRTEFGNTESDDLDVEVGFMPADGLRFTVGFEDQDLVNLSTITANAKMVRALGGPQALNLEATLGQTDDANDTISYQVGGDFYLNHDLSFGLSYEDTDQSNSNEDIEVRARMFFIPNLSGAVIYNMQDFNDRIALVVTGRF